MAKKQTTKKATSGKKHGILSMLNPNSPKKQFLMFIAIFAVIGGGVMVYRSYAASGFGIYTASQMTYSGPASLVSGTNVGASGGKSGTTSLQMAKGSVASIAPAYRSVIWAPKVRTCVNVYAGTVTTKRVYISVATHEDSKAISRKYFNIVPNGGYQKVCNEYGTHTNGYAKMSGEIKNEDSQNDVIYMASMSLEYTN